MTGWIKIDRSLLESEVWKLEKFTRGQAWVDMLLIANHKKSSFLLRGNTITVGRGQIARSKNYFAERWQWSRGKVTRYFSWLEEKDQIRQRKSKLLSIITIVNYKAFQKGEKDGNSDNKQSQCNYT